MLSGRMSNKWVFGIAAVGITTAVLVTKCDGGGDESKPAPAQRGFAHIASEDIFIHRKDALLGILKSGECVLLGDPAHKNAAMGKTVDVLLVTPSGNIKAQAAEKHLKPAPASITPPNCKANFYQALAVPGEPNDAGLPVVEFYKAVKPAQLYTAQGQPVAGRVADTGSCLAIDLAVQKPPVGGHFAIRAMGDDIVHAYVKKDDVEPWRNYVPADPCRAIFSANIPARPAP